MDKSIDYQTKSDIDVIHGNIELSVISISQDEDPKCSNLILEIELCNLGQNFDEQDPQLTLQYIKEFKNLEEYIQKNFVGEPKQSDLRFDLSELPDNSDSNYDLMQSNEQQKAMDIQFKQEMLLFSKTSDSENGILQQNDAEFQKLKLQVNQQLQQIEQNKHWSYCLKGQFQMTPKQEQDTQQRDQSITQIFKNDWKREEKTGTMHYINNDVINCQKQVVGIIIKKMGSNLIAGKSLLSVSLPIVIFEPQSNLQRYAASFVYAPTYLEAAANSLDPVFQMKQAMVFLFTTQILNLSLLKPFNPILGETYQGFIADCPIYLEQISHHPPTAAYQYYGRGYQFFGQLESVVNMSINSIMGHNYGDMKIVFQKSKNFITMMQSPGVMENLTIGKRNFLFNGKSYFYDLKNNLFGEIIYCPSKQGVQLPKKTLDNFFIGHIYKMTEKFKEKLIRKYQKSQLAKFKGLDVKKDVEQELSVIQGHWDENFIIDDKILWDINNGPFPHKLVNENNVLASDSSFRQDVLAWKLKDMQLGSNYKEILEELQRKDKKSRKKYSNK